MHVFPVLTGSSLHKKVISMMLATVAMFLSGCAIDRIREVGQPASECRVDSVLYCDVDIQLDIETCRCVRRGELRDALRNLARR